ncbi:MAG: hypothetical protein V4519_02465 [Patescibacteria group bacterium]
MKYTSGFVALLSVILISGFFSVASLSLVLRTRFLQQTYLINLDKQETLFAALSCSEIAQMQLQSNAIYSGDEYYPVFSKTCYISSISTELDTYTYTTIASSTLSYSEFMTTISSDTLLIQQQDRIFHNSK